MTPLARLQQDFTDFLRDRPSAIRGRIQGGPHADLDTLLGIYRHAYTGRLVGILGEEFPKLRSLAGEPVFDDLAHAYLAAHPSRYFSVRWIGRELPDFLATADPWCRDPGFSQIARIEWAETMAFDAADDPPAARADLAAVPPTGWPGLVLTLHPSVNLIPVSPDIFAIWNRLANGEPAGSIPPALASATLHLVWRIGLDVKLRAAELDEAAALDALCRGQSFAAICERLADHVDPEQAAFRAAELLERWVSTEMIGRIAFSPDMSS